MLCYAHKAMLCYAMLMRRMPCMSRMWSVGRVAIASGRLPRKRVVQSSEGDKAPSAAHVRGYLSSPLQSVSAHIELDQSAKSADRFRQRLQRVAAHIEVRHTN